MPTCDAAGTCPPRQDDLGYASRCQLGVFVFPHPNDRPAGLAQQPVRLGVTFTVLNDFVTPKILVALRRPIMSRTPVPEATVHEYRDTGACEDKISRPTN